MLPAVTSRTIRTFRHLSQTLANDVVCNIHQTLTSGLPPNPLLLCLTPERYALRSIETVKPAVGPGHTSPFQLRWGIRIPMDSIEGRMHVDSCGSRAGGIIAAFRNPYWLTVILKCEYGLQTRH
jgi:hypothetical protein